MKYHFQVEGVLSVEADSLEEAKHNAWEDAKDILGPSANSFLIYTTVDGFREYV